MIRHTHDQLSESTKAFLKHSIKENVIIDDSSSIIDSIFNRSYITENNYGGGSLGTQRFLMEQEGGDDDGGDGGEPNDHEPSWIDRERAKETKRLIDDVLRDADRKAFCFANPDAPQCQDDYEEPETPQEECEFGGGTWSGGDGGYGYCTFEEPEEEGPDLGPIGTFLDWLKSKGFGTIPGGVGWTHRF